MGYDQGYQQLAWANTHAGLEYSSVPIWGCRFSGDPPKKEREREREVFSLFVVPLKPQKKMGTNSKQRDAVPIDLGFLHSLQPSFFSPAASPGLLGVFFFFFSRKIRIPGFRVEMEATRLPVELKATSSSCPMAPRTSWAPWASRWHRPPPCRSRRDPRPDSTPGRGGFLEASTCLRNLENLFFHCGFFPGWF